MFTGTHNYLNLPQKKCCNCKMSKSVYELYACGKCTEYVCVPCMKLTKNTATCECSKFEHPSLQCNHYMICQSCYNRKHVTCCKNLTKQLYYCDDRYFGYCDNCFESRLLFLANQDISTVSRGYLMYIIKGELIKKPKDDSDLMKLYDKYVHDEPTHYLFNFVSDDKLSTYIWKSYVTEDIKTLTNMELYIMEIVLKKYITISKKISHNLQVKYNDIIKTIHAGLS